jgi:hypothetical protein
LGFGKKSKLEPGPAFGCCPLTNTSVTAGAR